MTANAVSRRTFLQQQGLGAAATLLLASGRASAGPAQPPAARPNVVVILADDLGNADVGFQGCRDIPTPHIDSIARNGVRFTNGYVSGPYCSPTRAGLMTGRYQQRFGHEFNEGTGRLPFGLPLTETTFAQRMKDLGYATCGIGKWHLGNTPEFRPMRRGFDEYYGTLANTPFYHPNLLDSRVGPDPKRVEDPAFYATEAWADRAVEFIGANRSRPFFLYLPFNACHMPLQAPQKYIDRVGAIADENRRIYAAVMSAMDDAIGRVLATLREAALEENTLVVFLSDNGGQRGVASDNLPLRGRKASTWDGGIRVPFAVQWKGHLPAGKTFEAPVIQLDLLPTAVAAAGGKVAADWQLDGVNLLPHLTGQATGAPHESLYWRFGPQWAIRQGDWKLVQGTIYPEDPKKPMPGGPPKARVHEPMLFTLAEDVGEQKDLAAQQPERVKAMRAAYESWNQQLAEPGWIPVQQPGKKKKAAAKAAAKKAAGEKKQE